MSRMWREKYPGSPVEVILVAVSTQSTFFGQKPPTYPSEWHRSRLGFDGQSDRYCGIVIERYQGCARRVGVTGWLTRMQWLSGHPQKELIVLI